MPQFSQIGWQAMAHLFHLTAGQLLVQHREHGAGSAFPLRFVEARHVLRDMVEELLAQASPQYTH